METKTIMNRAITRSFVALIIVVAFVMLLSTWDNVKKSPEPSLSPLCQTFSDALDQENWELVDGPYSQYLIFGSIKIDVDNRKGVITYSVGKDDDTPLMSESDKKCLRKKVLAKRIAILESRISQARKEMAR